MRTLKMMFLILLFIFMQKNIALACNVPVCNIPARVEELKKLKQVDRYQAAFDLRKQYRNSHDTLVWRNLFDFSSQMIVVTQQLQDEDWVIRESQTLQSESAVGLMRFGVPHAAEYVSFYKILMNEGYRFQVLNHWVKGVEALGNAATIRELIWFVTQAEVISKERDDPEYVFREMISLQGAAAKRLALLDPFHEGTYELVPDCNGPAAQLFKKMFPTESPCGGDRPNVTRLYVMESLSSYGLSVGFFDDDYANGEPRYVFQNVYFDGAASSLQNPENQISGTYQVSAEFYVKIDPQTGNLLGWIRDSRTQGNAVFKGKSVKRTVRYFRDGNAIPKVDISQVEGTYVGKPDQPIRKLIVKRFREDRFTASMFMSDNPRNPIIVDYQVGKYISDRSLLTLVRANDAVGFVKAILGFRKDRVGKQVLTGYYYSIRNGMVQDVEFEKAREVEPRP